MATVALCTGTTIVYILGSVLRWTTVAAICAVLSATNGILHYVWLPESPKWLFQNKRWNGNLFDIALNKLFLGIRMPEKRFYGWGTTTKKPWISRNRQLFFWKMMKIIMTLKRLLQQKRWLLEICLMSSNITRYPISSSHLTLYYGTQWYYPHVIMVYRLLGELHTHYFVRIVRRKCRHFLFDKLFTGVKSCEVVIPNSSINF